MWKRRTIATIACVAVFIIVGWLDFSRLDFLYSKAVAFATRIIHSHVSGHLEYFQAPLIASAAPIELGTYKNFPNAQDYSPKFAPYARTSVWNMPISSRPTILPNSTAIVAAQFPGGLNPTPVRATEAGQYDYMHPRFFATASDPLVSLRCTEYCGAPDNGGVPGMIHVPAKARPAGGHDGHFDVIQPNGTEIDFWAVNGTPGGNMQRRDWQSGDTITAANIVNCGSFADGEGRLSVGPGSTAADFCTNAGIVTAAELLSGQIQHALFVSGECAIGAQYPAAKGASTQQCTSGLGPPLGGREWYDVPCSETQADSALKPWEKAILCALNVYGGYFGDNGDGGKNFTGGVAPFLESEEPWRDYGGVGYTSPFAPLAAQGWYSVRIPNAVGGAAGARWIGADPWNPPGINFRAHIHWLAPCSAQRTC